MTLQEVIRAVRRAGARATDTCGCHIHVSGEEFTGRTLGNLVKIFYRQQEIIIQTFGVRPERLSKYTKPIDPELIKRIEKEHPTSIADMNTIWFGTYTPHPQHYHPSRYSILNLASLYQKGSIEFRGANSSLHAGMIRAYIVFSLALVAKALNSKRACGKPRKYDPRSAKFDFRVFAAIGLGLMGDEFKNVRRNLLKNLPGDSAWKYGRPTSLCKAVKKGEK
ncbi:MAG: amidoligase family protein [Armatimonadota bacterium]